MNTDVQFLNIEDLRRKIVKLLKQLQATKSRLEKAKLRYAEANILYSEAEAQYLVIESRLRDRMKQRLVSSSSFQITLATSLVVTFQERLQQQHQQVQQAEATLTESQKKLEQAKNSFQVAHDVLTATFAEKKVNVPHLVEQATLPTVQSIVAYELQCDAQEEDFAKSRELLEQEQKSVDCCRADLALSWAAEEQLIEAKLDRRRQQALHEKTLRDCKLAMISTQSLLDELQCNILELQVQLHRLLRRKLQ